LKYKVEFLSRHFFAIYHISAYEDIFKPVNSNQSIATKNSSSPQKIDNCEIWLLILV